MSTKTCPDCDMDARICRELGGCQVEERDPNAAWGHYCARPDMQSEFMLDERGYPRTIGRLRQGRGPMNKERLLNVARALRESPNPEKFDMRLYAESCETPACAWGHYCARPDMQSEFMLDERGYPRTIGGGDAMLYDGTIIDYHFGLNSDQAVELFGSNGCGEAQTAIEAAEYIEGFVAHHEERP